MAGNKSVGRSGASQSVRSAKRRENLSVSAAESLQAPQGDGQQARDEQQQQRGGRREGRTHHVRARVLARTAATSDTSDATNGICHRARCYLYLFQLRVRVVVAEIVADFFFTCVSIP